MSDIIEITSDDEVIGDSGSDTLTDDEAVTVVEVDAPVAPVDDEAILLDIWVDDRALRSIRRYVKHRDPEEGVFALSHVPLDECEWLADRSLGFGGSTARLRSVGTVVASGFHADIHHYPEFKFAIELARPVDKAAMAEIYTVCDPQLPVPPYLEASKVFRQRSASFTDVFKATKGIRGSSPRIPFTCVCVGDVVLTEVILLSNPDGLAFELCSIYLVAQAPIVVG
ncbi:hypothetical protein K466DRAFT_601391 [Polyporus arcularius HHB13444]|uniref:Uncharacterized protein n=1 Tax=Polyporus arcularius HHB13444 TaxID=1314778 RepID=A0A5C3PAF0_9APHY|nr:hypothetical protein K466DRAFT_601391 [Polyporus arcularius HHB13444]